MSEFFMYASLLGILAIILFGFSCIVKNRRVVLRVASIVCIIGIVILGNNHLKAINRQIENYKDSRKEFHIGDISGYKTERKFANYMDYEIYKELKERSDLYLSASNNDHRDFDIVVLTTKISDNIGITEKLFRHLADLVDIKVNFYNNTALCKYNGDVKLDKVDDYKVLVVGDKKFRIDDKYPDIKDGDKKEVEILYSKQEYNDYKMIEHYRVLKIK